MAESVKWGEKGARVNSISPGIIVTPLALDAASTVLVEISKNMFAKCPVGRPGTADEVGDAAELMTNERGALITGAHLFTEGGATAPFLPRPPQKDEGGRMTLSSIFENVPKIFKIGPDGFGAYLL
ncbi:MAG: SDR family oxidoreductase [Merdibacter sp.]